jgi:hypothetical protein
MTALLMRQALATVITSVTAAGTTANPVANIFYFRRDQIPFDQTPALIVTSPDDDESFTTLGANRSEQTLKIDVDYLDAPLQGDDLQAQMATVEAWFEQAKINLRRNPQGTIATVRGWAWMSRMRTVIDQPLVDQGRVLYHGCLYVWLRANLTGS